MNLSAIPKGSILGRVLRAALKVLPPSIRLPILQGPARGSWWIVGAGNHGCWLGSFESEKQRQVAATVRPGHVVYDVGAHAGSAGTAPWSSSQPMAGIARDCREMLRTLGYDVRTLAGGALEESDEVVASFPG